MLLHTLVLAAALQFQSVPTPAASRSPIARVVVTTPQRTVVAGDSLQLRAEALDDVGRRVETATIRFAQAGAWFEAEVDTLGMVRAGSTGIVPVTVVAYVPGTKPVLERVEIQMVPGPAARVELERGVEKLVVGQRVRLGASARSAAGDLRRDAIAWSSSAPGVVRVGDDGLLSAVAPGRATITATAGAASARLRVTVVANTIGSIEIAPSAPRARQGDVIRFRVAVRDRSGQPITGLTPSWSFSPGDGVIGSDGAFVGYNAGTYVVTASFGTRTADAIVRLEHRDVRRPLTVVGRLPRSLFTTEEVWLHPGGKYAYLGTGSGGDRMYAIDISDPSNPVVTDSIVANTRRVNDVMSTPDGRFLVFTREGAADRRNGIVIASLEDPAHPKPIAEFTEGVTAGVHSAFIYSDPRHGTHVYLTNDGTNAMHVINIDDPYHPKEVAQYRSPSPNSGGSLHDIDVQDGLAYLSYWNDNLVILDVGNGMRGGSPSKPVLVSQYRYDLNEMYRDVESSAGPGFIRGTHTAWRHKNYVFIADEVFPARPVTGAKDAAAGRAYGNLQVIDVSDIDNPKAVAHYKPDFGGVHNIWVAGDTLYMGAYNGGFRVFDVSGELKGDLRAQGREIAHLNTADMDGKVKNAAMTWGVVVKDGLAYVNDMYNGLWIVRIEPAPPPVP